MLGSSRLILYFTGSYPSPDEAMNVIKKAFREMNMWNSDVMPLFLCSSLFYELQLQLFKPTPNNLQYVCLSVISQKIYFDSSDIVHSLLSVTYQLHLGFWTSLLLKLCDSTSTETHRGVCVQHH